ncbi:hypothetical protein BCR33DRAFT_714657 [Rhizoclosmatium globosum]|uniref:SPIN90/Ldb17 leucine-rich domain-containing protein n=1 Tax=Rhizoclosmatium globosum TaxID=329046 RepID=A0A1Y2CMU6_9FUNG|nr:hypothetical protein BCR33DRAFT_714657 [Rhizoclosmatium globosum]|eukprot:ORY48256.1 hypothetical protein BCR33DRAFT_714657 [Rhizoclosmatium globosum]
MASPKHLEALLQLMTDVNALLDQALNAESAIQAAVDALMANHTIISTGHEMDVLCEHIVRHSIIDSASDEALAELLFLLKGLLKDLNENLELGRVVLTLIYYLGIVYGANVIWIPAHPCCFGLLLASNSLSRCQLLFQVCLLQEMSISELNEFTPELIVVLFDSVERTSHSDELEDYNYALIKLLLVINDQFMMKNHARNVIENQIIACLSPRLFLGKSLGGNIIFMFNRADNSRLQRLIIRFLYIVFKTPETATFFYTNDLRVILDVVLRESRAVADEDEEIQQGYLNLLPALLHNSQLQNYKLDDVKTLLGELRRQDSGNQQSNSPGKDVPLPTTPLSAFFGNPSVKPSTRRVAERVFFECREILSK